MSNIIELKQISPILIGSTIIGYEDDPCGNPTISFDDGSKLTIFTDCDGSILSELSIQDSEITDRVNQFGKLEEGHYATELISWLTEEPFSDPPACLSPVLGAFLRNWDNNLNQDKRERLKPFLLRAVNTADDGHDEKRARLAADWLIRTHTPLLMDLAGLHKSSKALRSLQPITTDSVLSVRGVLKTIQAKRIANRITPRIV